MSLSERLQILKNGMKESNNHHSFEEKGELFQKLKAKMHSELINRIDISNLAKLEREKARQEIRAILENLLVKEKIPLNQNEEKKLIREVEDETFGLGPLEPLLSDPTISDILVNHPKQVFVERFGKLEHTDVVFRDDVHLIQIIDRIVSRVGRRIDESQPMVDARLADGSRVNAIIPPLALNGSSLSIRKFKRDPLKMQNLVSFGTLTSDIAKILELIVKAKLNLIISGGT